LLTILLFRPGQGEAEMLKITKSRFYLVPVLMRTLDVLETLANSDVPLKMNEISHKTRISKTTTYRILRTLVYRGYVGQDIEGRFSLLKGLEGTALPQSRTSSAGSASSGETGLTGDQVIEVLHSVLQTLRPRREDEHVDNA
jgi:hypothetical protein